MQGHERVVIPYVDPCVVPLVVQPLVVHSLHGPQALHGRTLTTLSSHRLLQHMAFHAGSADERSLPDGRGLFYYLMKRACMWMGACAVIHASAHPYAAQENQTDRFDFQSIFHVQHAKEQGPH